MYWKTYNIRTREVGICISILAFIGLLFGVQRWQNTGTPTIHESDTAGASHATHGQYDTCTDFPDTGHIAVAIRTSAPHAFARLPIQLITSLVCVKQPLLFSDLDQTLGHHRVRDVLTRVSEDRTGNNPDFEIYWKQKHLLMLGRETEVRALQDMPAADEASRALGLSASDVLARYVRLHMVDRAWELQPEREWYVFVEDDTFLVWSSLVLWLRTLDPEEQHYLTPSPGQGTRSGSAFVLSRAAMRLIGTSKAGLGNRWDGKIRSSTSVDELMVSALKEELQISPTTPEYLIPVQPLHLMPFSQTNLCKHLVALPLLPPRSFNALYRHQLLSKSLSLRYQDVHNATGLASGLPFKRRDWDNASNDPATSLAVIPNERPSLQGTWEPKDYLDPHKSFEACEFACIANHDCYQFLWTSKPRRIEPENHEGDGNRGQAGNPASRKRDLSAQTECSLSSVFRLGEQREQIEGEVYVSGWRNDRIGRLADPNVACEGGLGAEDWK